MAEFATNINYVVTPGARCSSPHDAPRATFPAALNGT
jgi:hypothetical protein